MGLAQFGFVCVIVSGMLLTVTNSQSCPDRWTFYNNQCYSIIYDSTSFSAAVDNCAKMGSTLASVTNNDTYSFLWNLIRPSWLDAGCVNTIQMCNKIIGQACTASTSDCNLDTCRKAGCTQFWIGLYKYNTTCDGCNPGGPSVRQGWSWLRDNMTYDSTSGWNNWHDVKPTGGTPCARLGVSNHTLAGYFGDSDCSYIFNYICQMSAIPMSVSSTRSLFISTTPSTYTTNSTSANSPDNLSLIIGLSVGVTLLGVLLLFSIIIIVMLGCRLRSKAPADSRTATTAGTITSSSLTPIVDKTATIVVELPYERLTQTGNTEHTYQDLAVEARLETD